VGLAAAQNRVQAYLLGACRHNHTMCTLQATGWLPRQHSHRCASFADMVTLWQHDHTLATDWHTSIGHTAWVH
jgi:hypothetical protein